MNRSYASFFLMGMAHKEFLSEKQSRILLEIADCIRFDAWGKGEEDCNDKIQDDRRLCDYYKSKYYK